MLTRSKGSWAQFIFICRSHFATELYSATDLYSIADLCFVVDYFYLHFFLWKFLALRSSWWVFRPCFSLGFLPHKPLGTYLQKWASTFSLLSIWIAPAIRMRKLMQFSFAGCLTIHMRMLLFFSSLACCFNIYSP